MKIKNQIKVVISFVFFCVCLGVNAQGTDKVTEIRTTGDAFLDNLSNAFNGTGMWIKNHKVRNNIQGTPYLYENWFSYIEIFTEDNKSYKLPNSNFNLLNNKFCTRVNNDSIFTFNKDNLNFVKLNNKVFKKIKLKNDQESFFEVLFDGKKNAFLKRYEKKIKKGKINPMTQKAISKDKFVKYIEYYIYENEKLTRFKLKKSNILKILDNREKDIKNFVKSNEIDFKSEIDLIKLFKFYNS